MKWWLFGGVVGFGLLMLPPGAAQPGKQAARKGWLAGLDSGKALAKKTGKPLMVVFRCEP